MPFQTGTATSFVNLLDTMRLFATANGWTENSWVSPALSLQKGTIYANFSATANDLQMKGSLGYSGAAAWNAQPSTHAPVPWMRDGFHGSITWPATYWMFIHTSPDDIVIVLRYQPTRFLYMTFGQLLKYGTYTGGEYYAASSDGVGGPGVTIETPVTGRGSQIPNSPGVNAANFAGLFWRRTEAGAFTAGVPDVLHAEIDSFTWGGPTTGLNTPYVTETTIQFLASASDHTFPLQNRLVSAFNGLATLQPIEVFALRPDAHYSPLGRVEHLRYANVINHNPADIIDIGGQKWMLFPWTEKGGPGDSAGQHYGYAVKYDGP